METPQQPVGLDAPNYFLGSRTNGNLSALSERGQRAVLTSPNYFLGSRTNGNFNLSMAHGLNRYL